MPRNEDNKPYKDPWLNDRGGDLSRRWYVIYAIRDQSNNWVYKQKFISSKKFPTAEARRSHGIALTKAIKELLEEKFQPGKQPAVHLSREKDFLVDAINDALKAIGNKLERTTHNSYRSEATLFIEWLEQNNLVGLFCDEFNEKVASQYLIYIGAQNISNNTYNKKKQHLSSVFNEIIEQKRIQGNVWQNFKNRKRNEVHYNIWTVKDLKAFFQYVAKNDPYFHLAALLEFQVYTRPIELCRLKVKDFDLDKGLVWLDIKKGNKYRKETGSLSREIINLVDSTIIKPGVSKESYVFGPGIVPGDTPIKTQRFAERLRNIKEEIKFERPEAIFYELKHTGVSIADLKGIPLRNIQRQCRHQSITTTEIYLRKLKPANDNYFKEFPNLNSINY